ncbi:MAG: Nramp family divalent metal transporter [Haloferacaceae archaeon]
MATSRLSLRRFLVYVGPGFLISVAYMDPGNWATNIAGGARYGTALLWVVVLSSLMAIVIQIVAAKLGIATGENIARLCRDRFPRPLVYVSWVAAELAMIATDIAEIIGAGIGFRLLFGVPLAGGAVLAGALSFLLLGARSAYRQGYRAFELLIAGFVAVIGFSFLFELVLARPDAAAVAGGLVPSFPDSGAIFYAAGILGATVMPHSIYLHTQLVQDRRGRAETAEEAAAIESQLFSDGGAADAGEPTGDTTSAAATGAVDDRLHFKLEAVDTGVALFGAMFVNGAMLVLAATALFGSGVATIEAASATLQSVFGPVASQVFGLALVAAGLSSSFVATMAGQTVMDGFLNYQMPAWSRRLVTLVPSLTIVLLGFETTTVLVASQVALSLELPFILLPLLWFSSRSAVAGEFRNRRSTTALLGAIVALIIGLNLLLIADAAGIGLPF